MRPLQNPTVPGCVDYNPCYPDPLYCNSNPFGNTWWAFILNNPNCIDRDQACCPVVDLGGDTYAYVSNQDVQG